MEIQDKDIPKSIILDKFEYSLKQRKISNKLFIDVNLGNVV